MALIVPGKLPNMRRLITPDPGYDLIDMDLSRADAQVVAWDSGDEALKNKFKEEQRDPTKDVHSANALSLFGVVNYQNRQYAKIFCHGTNYGALPKTLARQCNITIAQAEAMQQKWFAAHPDIRTWHGRIQHQLNTTRTITNAFGYSIFFFDRPDSCFNEALAWTPQSTVGHVINLALCNIAESKVLREVRILLQNHDSLVMQTPQGRTASLLPLIREASQIVIPYQDPLVIPVGFKVSKTNWGECHETRQRPDGIWEIEASKGNWVVLQ